jgi:hypothetical protein
MVDGRERPTAIIIRRTTNDKNSQMETNKAARFDTVSQTYLTIAMSSAS